MTATTQSAGAMRQHPPAWSPDVRRSGDVKTISIPLTQGKYAVIDADDADKVLPFNWCAHGDGPKPYAIRRALNPRTGKKEIIYLHRVIIGASRGQLVDHIDGNPLNNCRSNLRLCTPSQNVANSLKSRGSSQFRGVSWFRKGRCWRSTVKDKGRQVHIGYFADEIEAARAYDEFARNIYGEFGRYNFPLPGERSAHASRDEAA